MILQELGADARLVFPQDHAPFDRELAEAVIGFASGLLDPDDPEAFGSYLDDSGKTQLDAIDFSVGWFEAVEPIEGVRVVSLSQEPRTAEEADTATVMLALQEQGEAYALAWSGRRSGGRWVFSGIDVGYQTRARAADFDGVDAGSLAASASGGPALDIDIDAIMENALGDALSAAFMKRATERMGRDLPDEAQGEIELDPEDDEFNEFIVERYGSVDGFEDAVRAAELRLDDGERPEAGNVIPALQITYAFIEGFAEMMAAMMAGFAEGFGGDMGGEGAGDVENEMEGAFDLNLPPMVEVVADVLGVTEEEAQAYIDEGSLDEIPSIEQLMESMGESTDFGPPGDFDPGDFEF